MTLLRNILVCAALACSAQAADAPRMAPPLDILRPGTTPLKLEQYRGKVVVLALIFTTCSHCQEFTGVLNRVAPEYTARGVQFLECAFNDDAPTSLGEFVTRFRPTFPIGYNTQATIHTFLRRPVMETRPLYVPHLMVLDRTGKIEAEYPGQDDFFHNPEPLLRSLLDKMLKPAAPGKKK